VGNFITIAKIFAFPDAGHSMSEPGIRSVLIEATDNI
jgi:hypothetical protein